MRRYLVHTAAARGVFVGEFLCEGRTWDVAINDWTGCGDFTPPAVQAEYRFAMKCHKWPGVAALCKLNFFEPYDYVAFIDEDIQVTGAQIRELFETGVKHELQLYQPALTLDSYSSHEFLRQKPDFVIRGTSFVEIMMPFFSREALEKCRQSFELSELGWGLEYVWRDLLRGNGMAIIDKIAVKHTRPVQSNKWKNSRGEDAGAEQIRMLAEWGARSKR